MALMSQIAVSIQDLSFRYPGTKHNSLEHLHLEVGAGERFGLFGPNGAGKTTLMNCMTGLLTLNAGTIRLFGLEPGTNKKQVNRLFGFVPQDFSFYHELTPRENLEFFGAWSGMTRDQIKERSGQLLEVLELTHVQNTPVHKFSGGMKRKVNLAIGVIHNPSILFLDEPTVGVDIQTRNAIITYLKSLNKDGTTLIYTSHQLYEAQELCNTIALLDAGRIIAHDSLSSLLSHHREEGLEGLFIQLTGKKFRDA